MGSSKSFSPARTRSRRSTPSASPTSRWTHEGPRRPEALAALLEQAIGELGVQDKLAACRAILAWPEIVGPALAERTRPLRVHAGRLEVAVPAAVWRTQLSFMQQDLTERLNHAAGAEVITGLVLLNRPL